METVTRNYNSTTFSNFGTNEIITIAFLAGYKTQMGTTGLNIKLRATIASSSTYQLMIETGGDAKISEVTFFILAFDKDEI